MSSRTLRRLELGHSNSAKQLEPVIGGSVTVDSRKTNSDEGSASGSDLEQSASTRNAFQAVCFYFLVILAVILIYPFVFPMIFSSTSQ